MTNIPDGQKVVLIDNDNVTYWDSELVTAYDCPKCYGLVRAGDNYCPNCGIKIEWY